MSKPLTILLLCVAILVVIAIASLSFEQYEDVHDTILTTGGDELVRQIYDASCEYVAKDGQVVTSGGLLTAANLYDGSRDAESLYISGIDDNTQQLCYLTLEDGVECSKKNKDIYRDEHGALVSSIKTANMGPYFGDVCAVTLQKGLSPKLFQDYMTYLKEAPVQVIKEQQNEVMKETVSTDESIKQLDGSVSATRVAIQEMQAKLKAQQDSNKALGIALQKANAAKAAAEKRAQEAQQKLNAAKAARTAAGF
jgi:hypothetical protein